ncbi:alpha/beta hydrolase [Opitutaceae bacterium]|nr:alpha/beta hydrolase [Opitutaceae bacterium]
MRNPSIIRSLVFGLISALVVPGLVAQSDQPDEIVTYREVDGTELKMHVFLPHDFDASDRRPAVVFFFGGGWNGGNPGQFYPFSEYLTERGMVAMAAEYRTKKSHGTDPFACVADAKAAMRWARQNAAKWGIDPHRLAAGGGSAGGHLAATTAFLPGLNEEGAKLSDSCVPDALILYNPVIDNGPTGYGYDRIGDRFPEFSPLHNIGPQIPPPTITFLGTNDDLIPVATMRTFADAIRREGGRCDVHIYENAPHGFFNKRDWGNLRYYEVVRATDRFLGSLGWLEGDPTMALPEVGRTVEPAKE